MRQKTYSPLAKLTPRAVRLIRHWYKAGRYSQNELAQHFGVSQATVSNLLRAKVYQRVVS